MRVRVRARLRGRVSVGYRVGVEVGVELGQGLELGIGGRFRCQLSMNRWHLNLPLNLALTLP